MENFTGVSLNSYFLDIEDAVCQLCDIKEPYLNKKRIRNANWIYAVQRIIRTGYYRFYIRWVKAGGGLNPKGESPEIIAFCSSIREIQTQAHGSEYKLAKLLAREKIPI